MTTQTPPSPGNATAATDSVQLIVGGMTCASCAARIEKKLNRLEGVSATVNFATETAAVVFDPTRLTPADLISTVQATGYTAALPQPITVARDDGGQHEEDKHDHGGDETDSLRQRLLVSAALTVPVVAARDDLVKSGAKRIRPRQQRLLGSRRVRASDSGAERSWGCRSWRRSSRATRLGP